MCLWTYVSACQCRCNMFCFVCFYQPAFCRKVCLYYEPRVCGQNTLLLLNFNKQRGPSWPSMATVHKDMNWRVCFSNEFCKATKQQCAVKNIFWIHHAVWRQRTHITFQNFSKHNSGNSDVSSDAWYILTPKQLRWKRTILDWKRCIVTTLYLCVWWLVIRLCFLLSLPFRHTRESS